MEKLYFKILLLVLLVVGVFLVSDYLQGFNSLQLKIRTDKQVYETGEHITLEYELKNIGADKLRINRNFALQNDIIPHFIQITSKKELEWLSLPPALPVNEKSFIDLEPQETLKNKIEMLDSYLTVTRQEGYPQPGTYSIQLDYAGKSTDNLGNDFDAWEGRIKSNTVEILVREKVG